jgi:hypothetical protein
MGDPTVPVSARPLSVNRLEWEHIQRVLRDNDGNIGAFEAALLDTPMANPEQPLEILRTIHSFDPCLACATHVYDATGKEVTRVQVR